MFKPGTIQRRKVTQITETKAADINGKISSFIFKKKQNQHDQFYSSVLCFILHYARKKNNSLTKYAAHSIKL